MRKRNAEQNELSTKEREFLSPRKEKRVEWRVE
jgi:hypothetical protein